MFLGLDLGTSAVKALLVDGERARGRQRLRAAGREPHPAPGHAEQAPDAWWAALLDAVDALQREHAAALSAVARHRPVRADARCGAAGRRRRGAAPGHPVERHPLGERECAALEAAAPTLRAVAGNIAMPGFTAPKLLWVRSHEPDGLRPHPHRAAAQGLAAPAPHRREDRGDVGRLRHAVAGRGRRGTGPSRCWPPPGSGASTCRAWWRGTPPPARCCPELAARWGMAPGVGVLAGGAEDNAAGAVGLGAIRAGDAFVSLGTSGVLFATTERFRPYPQAAVHAFCHALPGACGTRWA